MRIAFHSEQLGFRGVEVSIYDFAYYNRSLLNNESIIIAPKKSDLRAIDKFKSEFEVVLYENFYDVEKIVDKNKIDCVYYQKAGYNDGKIVSNAKNLVHSVFQYNDVHGDRYAYVSEWLSKTMSNGNIPYVPLMVDILKWDHNQNYRDFIGIPKDSIVFGYYGGSDSFNIDFVKKAVIDIASNFKNIYFIFMNIDPFCDNSNVIFFEGSTDFYKKIAFINTCDALLHARNGGESFGLTVAEFSIKNKPVITTKYCSVYYNDLAHLDMLKDKCILYHDYNSLMSILCNFNDIKSSKSNWNAYEKYNPEFVMSTFNSVFLQ